MDVTKIKQLREKTGAGISECREALEKSGDDFARAEAWLTEHGISKAAKKADRETSQGVIESYVHGAGKIGVLVEINCETDFVARTDDFKSLAHEVALQISAMNPKTTAELMKQPYIRDPKTISLPRF
jgi:elongation factor Ts